MAAFSKILIANRGEIACRVIRTARAMGYRTVAVHSAADQDARHVEIADEAVYIGPSQVSQSYLNIDAIIKAAVRTGADAIHPGYGFLSENNQFAARCQENHIVFIGPNPHAIELMGSKRLSKIAMLNAGVPCIPGYEGDNQDPDHLQEQACRIGFPLMVKASAGGGGRGMRLVHSEAEVAAALRTARSEALNAFGSGELILERAVQRPRHVEIQVFGDSHGNTIYLGERDCSIQRRHQKVVEEAPCPVMTPELRRQMGGAAVAAARACQYLGAGTVEFLLDAAGEFYFLEMNTRLQVEHPVTEMVTGLDLVEWQIRVARGEALPIRQDDVRLKGHAIEVRFYAEDPATQFLPQTGHVQLWKAASGDGIRVDHGMNEQADISPYYDPMVAKIIAWGKDREEAARRLRLAVEDSVLLGVNSNKRFLANLLAHPVFLSGNTHTGFIDEHFSEDSSLHPALPTTNDLTLATALFYLHHAPQENLLGWHSGRQAPTPLKIAHGENIYEREVLAPTPSCLQIKSPDGSYQQLDIVRQETQRLTYRLNGVRGHVVYAWDGEQLLLDRGHGNLVFIDATYLAAQKDHENGDGQLLAPMDGAIVDLLVQPGEQVSKGQTLLVLEAMKIEHQLKANCDGAVDTINVNIGQQVKKRQLLLTTHPTQH